MTGRYQDLQVTRGAATPYIVQALLGRPTLPDKEQLLEALRATGARVEPLSPDPSLLAFAWPEHCTEIDGKRLPLQHVVSLAERMPAREQLDSSLSQTWTWEGARAAAGRATATLILSDLMGSGVERRTRMRLFFSLVHAVLEETPVLALHWLPSQRLVNPATFLTALEEGSAMADAALNVRMFKPQARPGELFMDTVGLASFGLPDVQCLFHEQDPSAVAGRLHSVAAYLFENGDVIADGHTVPGILPGEVWRCRKVHSAVGPRRPVIELVPRAASPIAEA